MTILLVISKSVTYQVRLASKARLADTKVLSPLSHLSSELCDIG